MIYNKLNSAFIEFTDWVSWVMGTPGNIIMWIILVAAWFALFIINPQIHFQGIIPDWFFGNDFNFPLNTVTTLAELYIGFLIGASNNRNEQQNSEILKRLNEALGRLEQDNDIEKTLLREIKSEQVVIEQHLYLPGNQPDGFTNTIQ